MAQVPQGVGYQGVATDANGIELVNQAISIRVSVLSGSANGTIEWEETHATSTDTFGLFTLTIGQGTNTTNGVQSTFADISWGTNTHFLKIEMDVTGGSNYSFMGTNQMMSVPYALYAENANINYDSISNLLSNDSTFITNVNSGGSEFYLECVDMGVSVMCSGLGLDPTATLSSSNNYDYELSNQDDLNSNNYIDKPHWRKFKIVGLGSYLASGGELLFKCKYQGTPSTNIYPQMIFITPEIDNGEVYFYFIATEGTNGNCVNEANIGMSIPLSHAITVINSSSWGTSGSSQSNSRSLFEIFYESDSGFKNTGIILD